MPITNSPLALANGSGLVFLAKTHEGDANISRLFTLANFADQSERKSR